MNIEAKKRVAVDCLLNVSAMRAEIIPEYFAENATWWDLASRQKQSIKQLTDAMKSIRQLLPNGIPIEIKRVIGDGNWVVIEEEALAKLPNGTEYENCVTLLFEVNDAGKVVQVKEYLDPRSPAKAFGSMLEHG